jgi:hypothetical protein
MNPTSEECQRGWDPTTNTSEAAFRAACANR